MDNIFDVNYWSPSTSYVKDDFVRVGSSGGASGFSGFSGNSGYNSINSLFSNYFNIFFYVLTNHTSTASFQNDYNFGFWGGETLDSNGELKPEFFWTPDVQNKINHQPKVKTILFGDSYAQRIKDGVNNNLLQVELKFERRRLNEATAILHFLASRQAKESFLFTPRRPYNKRKRFIASQWTDTENSYNNITIDVRFDEVPN